MGVYGLFYGLSLPSNAQMQLNFAINDPALPTGRYPYKITVTESGTSTQTVTRYIGWDLHLNLDDSPFGSGWSPLYLDRLHLQSDGAILQHGNGNLWWLPELDDGTYGYEDINFEDGKRRFSLGDLTFSQLVVDGTGYKVTDKYGTVSYFNSVGAMTSRVDRNGNVESFVYADKDSDGISDEIVSMTDVAGRTTTFTYTGPRVTKTTDFASRETTYAYTGDNLTQILEPDPDGTGPLLAPKTTFAYDAEGNLTSYVQPDNKTTSFEYNWAGIVSGR